MQRLTAECQAAKEQVESKERQLIENSTAYEDKLDAEVTKVSPFRGATTSCDATEQHIHGSLHE